MATASTPCIQTMEQESRKAPPPPLFPTPALAVAGWDLFLDVVNASLFNLFDGQRGFCSRVLKGRIYGWVELKGGGTSEVGMGVGVRVRVRVRIPDKFVRWGLC